MAVAGLGTWAWSIARTEIYEDFENWTFDHQVRGEQATVRGYLAWKGSEVRQRVGSWFKIPPPPEAPTVRSITRPPEPRRQPLLETNGLVGRLQVPRLHLSGMVREGTGEDTLGLSLGHIPATALPGQNGNVAVAGHRDTLFRGLGGIHPKDLILFETPGGKYTYQVEATQIVKPENVSVLKPGEHPELTLITCYPFNYVGSAPDRFIVKARQLTPEAAPEPTLQTRQEPQPQPSAPAAEEPAESPSPRAEVAQTVRRSESRRPAIASRGSKKVGDSAAVRKVAFSLSANHSRELAPGISLGLTRTVAGHYADGWMWVMPDRRTIWLHDQSARQPVVFYGAQDGRRRELVITAVTKNSISGYLMLPPVSHGKATYR